jgi:hypothetical protein
VKVEQSDRKINEDTGDLNHPIDQMDLTDINRTEKPTTTDDTFSSAHRIVSRIDHMLHHKHI